MLLKQMQYFVTVVNCHSFTEAAEQCYISQSAISQQLKSLENELGVTLMKREGRQFELTPAGEYFYRHSRELLDEIEKLKKETIRLGEDQELTLKIGYLRCYGAEELQHAVANFTALYPEVSLSIINGTHEELYYLLKEKQVDVIISDQRRAFNHDYYNYELIYSDCYIEISSQNELSQKEYVTLDDLKRITCILVATKEHQLSEQEYYQGTLGFANQFLFSENLEQARLMVIGKRGFLPIEAVGTLSSPSQGITRIPLYHNGKPQQRKYCAFWKKDRTNYYIEEFVELFRQLLHKEDK